jgi:DNA-binding CsgD family transcriptional regulator
VWLSAQAQWWRVLAGGPRVSGLAGPFGAALEDDLRGAAAGWRRLDSPYEEAIELLAGDLADARRALAIFERLGAVPAASIARQRLAEFGVRGPRRETAANPWGLTQREAEVLERLQGRRTNAEIAAELVLSERTVHRHVSAVLAKLGVHTRVEAAALASGQPG